jgi:hypothetical protein
VQRYCAIAMESVQICRVVNISLHMLSGRVRIYRYLLGVRIYPGQAGSGHVLVRQSQDISWSGRVRTCSVQAESGYILVRQGQDMSCSGRVRIYPGQARLGYVVVKQSQDISFHIRHGQIYLVRAGSGRYILLRDG